MTDDEINIALGQLMGWERIHRTQHYYAPETTLLMGISPDTKDWHAAHVFTEDLNATNKVEEKLFPKTVDQLWNQSDLWAEYRGRLMLLCVGQPGGVIRATARQRSQCLVAVLCRPTPIGKVVHAVKTGHGTDCGWMTFVQCTKEKPPEDWELRRHEYVSGNILSDRQFVTCPQCREVLEM